jgi:hypothetical protein
MEEIHSTNSNINSRTASFPWARFIDLDKSLSAVQKSLLTHALDDIAAFKDGEGEQLIRKAAALSASGKVRFSAGESGASASNAGISTTITIDFAQARRVKYKQSDGSNVHSSLTGIVVHELYHAADPDIQQTSYQSNSDRLLNVKRALSDWIISQQLERFGVSEVYQAIVEMHLVDKDKRMKVKSMDLFSTEGVARDDIKHTLFTNGYPSLARALDKVPTKALDVHHILNRVGHSLQMNGKDGVLLSEVNATNYADAIMLKNYGLAEPQRGTYNNLITDGTELQTPLIPPLSPVAFCTPKYIPSRGIFSKLVKTESTPPSVEQNAEHCIQLTSGQQGGAYPYENKQESGQNSASERPMNTPNIRQGSMRSINP